MILRCVVGPPATLCEICAGALDALGRAWAGAGERDLAAAAGGDVLGGGEAGADPVLFPPPLDFFFLRRGILIKR